MIAKNDGYRGGEIVQVKRPLRIDEQFEPLQRCRHTGELTFKSTKEDYMVVEIMGDLVKLRRASCQN